MMSTKKSTTDLTDWHGLRTEKNKGGLRNKDEPKKDAFDPFLSVQSVVAFPCATPRADAAVGQLELFAGPPRSVQREAPCPEDQPEAVAQRQQPQVAQHLPVAQHANTDRER